MTKRPYETPAIRDVGSIADHTKANNYFTKSDGVFINNPGQPQSSLGS